MATEMKKRGKKKPVGAPLEYKIFDAMWSRITESWHKAEKKQFNAAYVVAFQIGALEDIRMALEKHERSQKKRKKK